MKTDPQSESTFRTDGTALLPSSDVTAMIFQHAPAGLARLSAAGEWLQVNDWLCRFLDTPAQQLIGQSWRNHSHPDDYAANWLTCSNLLAGKAKALSLGHRFLRRDGLTASATLQISTLPPQSDRLGTTLLFCVHPAMVKPDGFDPGTASLAKREARTNQLHWKERYESILLATGQVVYEHDLSTNQIIFTGDLHNLFGYSAKELAGGWKRWLEIIHPDDQHLLNQLRSTIAPGESYHLEYRVICKNGQTTSVRDDGCVVAVGGRNNVRLVGVLVDISEQRGLAMQLRHAQKMEVFGRLAGGVAHDFNNLLTVFSGYTDLLLAEFQDSDPRCEYLEEMQRAADRAASLTSQLLAFSRMQRSSPRELNLGDLLMEMRKMLRRLIGEDIELVMNIAEGLGLVFADPRQMETVLINLIVNARDAMPHGGRLSIELGNFQLRSNDRRTRAGWKPGPYVTLSVTDTGIGIDADLCTRIFEPFFTTKAPGEGTGLGLSTCYGIVEQGGGRITVDSIPGKGSTFRVYLPRIKSSAAQQSRSRPKSNQPLPRGNGETIMLVEDDLPVQKIYSTMLRQLGYTVICGSNGDEALRIAGQHPEISLVITDVVMPLMSGTDLAEELRHVLPKTKIVLTSGYVTELIESSPSLRRTPFLPKPLSRDILACTLRDLLETA